MLFLVVINEEKCPFDDVKIIASKQLTQNGDVLDFEHCGLKVTVPEGAIEEDYCVEIQVAVSLFGPFHVPSDCRPVSPYVWIAANYLFKRKLQIEFQHHADVSDTSKLCILKACCSKFSIRQMHITTQDHYVISDTVCTLLISMTAILSPPNYPYFDLVGRGLGIVHFPYLPCQVPPCTLIC